jgi:hypothetical protein
VVPLGAEAMVRVISDLECLSARGRSWTPRAAFWVAVSVAFSCASPVTPADTPPAPPSPTSITIQRSVSELTELDTFRFVASVLDQGARPIQDAKVSWTSRAPSMLGIDAEGLASANPTLKSVRTWIIASHAALADSIAVTVQPRIGSVEIREGTGPISVYWPDTRLLTAVVKNSEGVVLTGTPAVTWTSSDAARISVASVRRVLRGGFVETDLRVATATVVSLGDATITATVGDKSAQVVVSGGLSPDADAVVWPDTSHLPVSMTRTLMVQHVGVRVVLQGARWESSNSSVATVDGRGQVTAVGDGTATITAILPDRRLSAEVFVYHYSAPLRFTKVTTGSSHTCALTSDGAAYCWGQNDLSQLANDDVMDRCGIVGMNAHRCSEAPVPVRTSLRFTSISAGGLVTCGLTAAGVAYCWGGNADGRTGTGLADATVRTPTAVAGALNFTKIDVGTSRACGITAAGAAYCWGWRMPGNGTFEGSPTPVLVSGDLTWTTIRAGDYTACGLTTDGRAYCWGLNTAGQAGVPRETSNCPNSSSELLCVPTPVNTTRRFVQIESNDRNSQTCAIATDQRTYCWGTVVPYSRSLASTPVPSAVSGNVIFATLHNRRRPCGVTSGGAVRCWGGSPYDPVPVLSPPSFAARDFVQGVLHSCARDTDGIFHCWDDADWGLPFTWASSNAPIVIGSASPSIVAGQR